MRISKTILQFYVLCFFGSSLGFSQSLKKEDSLKFKLNTVADSSKWDVLYEIFKIYVYSAPDSALYYSEQAYDVALAIGDSMRIAKSLRARGDTKCEMGHYQSGVIDLERALEIATHNDFFDLRKHTMNQLGISYTFLGNFDKALNYNLTSLSLRREHGTNKEIWVSLNNVGLVYMEMRDFASAINYFQESYQMRANIEDKGSVEIVLVNIGLCYLGLGDYQNAVNYCELAVKSCVGRCEMLGILQTENALGNAYVKTGRYNEAEQILQKVNLLAKKFNSPKYEIESSRWLAEMELLKGNYQDAVEHATTAFELAGSVGLKLEQVDNLKLLATICSAMGDFQRSLDYQTQYIELLRSIFNGEMVNDMSYAVMKVNEQINLRTIKRQREYINLKVKESTQQILIIVSSAILGLLLIVLSFLWWRDMKLKNRINLVLDQKVRVCTRELEESYSKLEKAIVEQDESILTIGKKVQRSLATLVGITGVAKLDIEDPKAIKFISKIEKEAERIANFPTQHS